MAKKWISPSLAAVAVAVGMVACGGGGGGGGGDGTPLTVPVSGVAIDGNLYKASVFLDLNGDGLLTSGEPSAITDEQGKFTLTATQDQINKYKVIVSAIAGTTIDQDNPTAAISSGFTLAAPAGKPSVVSPLTTQVVAKMDAGATLESAIADIQKELKLGAVDVMQNYVEKKKTDANYAKAHNVAVTIVEVLKTVEADAGSGAKMSDKLKSLAAKVTAQVAPKVDSIQSASSPTSALQAANIPKTPQSITVTSVLATLKDSASSLLSAVITYTDKTTQNISALAEWAVTLISGDASGTVSKTSDAATINAANSGALDLVASYLGKASDAFRIQITCDAGSPSSNPFSSCAPPPPTLSGVAAIGAPLSGATITLVDSKGLSFTTTADAEGKYTFAKADIAAATPPFLITASTSLGDSQISHYTIVTSKSVGGWANVTPLTTAVAALASPTTIPSSLTKDQLAAITAQNVTDASTNVKSVIAPLAKALNLPASFDPLADKSFVADRTGADLLLDHIGVTLRTGAVAIANKMTVVSDTDKGTAAVTITKGAASTSTIAADKTDTSGLDALAKKFEKCFKTPFDSRLKNPQVDTATLAPDCQAVAASDYLQNGQPFMNRWATALNSKDMDGATFSAPVVRLRLQAEGNGLRERIAINFNFKDNLQIGYTRPEVAEKQADGTWILVGNKRPFNFYAEAALTYYDDVSTLAYNNTNSSRVDSGLRLSADPRIAIKDDGTVIYAALDMTQFGGTKDTPFVTLAGGLGNLAKAVGCVVVKGPGVLVGSKWQGFHPNGVLLKRPTASTVQDYMAIDAVIPDAARTAIDTAVTAANGSFGAGKPIAFTYATSVQITSEKAVSNVSPVSNNLCTYNFGNRAGTSTTLNDSANPTVWESTQSSSTYVVELAALGARKNALTGAANDLTIAGRDIAWNTGPRYARAAPSPELAKIFDNNPVITYEVFDTDGRLRAVMVTRYLGEMPPASMAKEYFDANRVSKLDLATLKRYLSFADNATTVSANQKTVTAQWTTSADAWGADRIVMYSEIQRAEVGSGTGATNGIANVTGTTKVSSLWTQDGVLAKYLSDIAGDNFYWWNSGYAKPTGTTTACTGDALVSSTGVNVARKTTSLTDKAIDNDYYGLDQAKSACILASGSTSTKAYVAREVGTRTYTDTNVRLYAYTANKAMRP
jgi:hypothetical protein